MTKSSKRKLWFLVLAVIVIMIPVGYFLKISVAVDMHDKAMRNAIEVNPGDTNVIKESIEQIDKAVWLYRHNYLFYATKAQLLCQLKEYHAAITELNKIHRFKSDYAEGYDYQGFIYDKLGLTDSANMCFKKAIDAQETRISKYSSDKEKVKLAKISIAFDRWLLNGQEIGKNELTVLQEAYPGDIAVAMFDSTLRRDRAEYVNNTIE